MNMLRHRENGASLLIGLIMLIVLTMFSLTALQVSRGSTQIIANMAARDASTLAANAALEQAVSTTRMFKSPAAVILNPCKGPNSQCLDINTDGKADITVTLTPNPQCVIAQTIPNAQLDVTDSEDAGCVVGAAQISGIIGGATGDSLCAESVWDVTAVAVDELTGASTTVNAGYGVRVATADVSASCPSGS